jgi:hypothetical protein
MPADDQFHDIELIDTITDTNISPNSKSPPADYRRSGIDPALGSRHAPRAVALVQTSRVASYLKCFGL